MENRVLDFNLLPFAAKVVDIDVPVMDKRLEALSKFMLYHYFQTALSLQELNMSWLFA